jgi:hypothetical protein
MDIEMDIDIKILKQYLWLLKSWIYHSISWRFIWIWLCIYIFINGDIMDISEYIMM